MKAADMVGKRFGRLLVISRAANNRQNKARWNCVCDCGCLGAAKGSSLRSGRTTRCVSCAARERVNRPALKHGMRFTREYRSYTSAIQRCRNPKTRGWENYGGRGIEFRFPSFEAFYAELGPRPQGTTLDRIDTNGHYEPGNVRWATLSQQRLNQRRTVPVSPPVSDFREIRS